MRSEDDIFDGKRDVALSRSAAIRREEPLTGLSQLEGKDGRKEEGSSSPFGSERTSCVQPPQTQARVQDSEPDIEDG